MDLSGADEERTHRAVQPKEAALSSTGREQSHGVRSLRSSPYLPHTLGAYLDPFTLKKLAGHESLETTMKYVHLNEIDSELRLSEARERMQKAGIRG